MWGNGIIGVVLQWTDGDVEVCDILATGIDAKSAPVL